MAKTLTELEEIRAWTAGRGGEPIMADMPDVGGKEQHLLGLTFDQHMLNADGNEGPDRPGSHFELVDWDTWYAALEAQGLVLVVDDDLEGDTHAEYRFMSRDEAGG
ncbi:hypothetical protein [Pelagibacterium luteolum]|uniref:Uncharacterized protein n=1 Tax=Pelagibacterium luteolum TaxID=440168 RepID=A0A1G7SF78_9HYPH|nr:hypothetical protein [Pelagibacterium luteolum]SDG21079.1 hypothetical protein SAMN04487974_101449 [Pelagibacterium luteolum]